MNGRGRVALVVQRYGLEVNGGAELLCRMIAERLATRYEVEVLTSCAIDYRTWRNQYPRGSSIINGVGVRRYPVTSERNAEKFDRLTAWLLSNPHTRADELQWMRMQGPDCPELLAYIAANTESYDAYVFFTYLYAPTCLGLPLVANRALLVPTAHDEPPIYLGIYDDVFRSARGLFFSTLEEKDFVLRRFCLDDCGEIVGLGVTPVIAPEEDEAWNDICDKTGKSTLITYVGRIDESKGCRDLFEHFVSYVRQQPNRDVKLLLLGKAVMPIPEHPSIVYAGFVPESTKQKAIAESRIIVIPSPYESLSIIALEAWTMSKPVLVNGECEVLRGQCRRSDGGLWYSDLEQFCDCLDRMLDDEALCLSLGRQGREWVLRFCSWERVDASYDRFIANVSQFSAASIHHPETIRKGPRHTVLR